jgi:NAD-dependent DNA ligase
MEINHTITMRASDELLATIKRHNELYRKGTPEVSDVEYDMEVEQLRKLDPDNAWLKSIEPTTVPMGRKVRLPIQMKSLNKMKSTAELQEWCKSLGLRHLSLVVMPKFDGVSLLHDEVSGKAYSRGGAENEGQNCDGHFKAAKILSPSTDLRYTFGEFVFSRQSWEKNFQGRVSHETGEHYKSPRNTAAGLINRDEPSKLLEHVSFYRYGADDASLENFSTYAELLAFLCKHYVQYPLYDVVLPENLTEEYLKGLFDNWGRHYYIDGLVVYINDLRTWKTIGRHSSTGNPLYAVAYKHPSFTDTFLTKVKGINWKVSKAGALKPVVNIEAVDTGDCSMENPTGYNAGWVSDKCLAKGAEVLVTRSGGVIPKILSTAKAAPAHELEAMWDGLASCPRCGEPTKWNSTHVELCCVNPNCPGIRLAKMVFFFTTCGVENMGEETIAKLYDAGLDSVASILNSTPRQLLSINGLGEAMVSVILENCARINKGLDMATLMHASDCFEGIGKAKAEKIMKEIDKERFVWLMSQTEPTKFLGVGEKIAEGVPECSISNKTYLSFFKGVKPFKRFLMETGIPIVNDSEPTINPNGKCAGMAVCFSGVRDAGLENAIRSEGGAIVNGVSRKTTHLLVDDAAFASSKTKRARELGVIITPIDQFKREMWH